MRGRKRQTQSDSSSNSTHESGPPPLPPIFSDLEEEPAISRRPSLHPQSPRPSISIHTDKQIPSKQRTLSNESRGGGSASAVPSINRNSDDDLSMHKLEPANLPSDEHFQIVSTSSLDEYLSVISDDYFSQLLGPFGGGDQDHDSGRYVCSHSACLLPLTKMKSSSGR